MGKHRHRKQRRWDPGSNTAGKKPSMTYTARLTELCVAGFRVVERYELGSELRRGDRVVWLHFDGREHTVNAAEGA